MVLVFMSRGINRDRREPFLETRPCRALKVASISLDHTQFRKLKKMRIRRCRRFASPLQKIAHKSDVLQVKELETIKPYTIPPWEERLTPGESLKSDSWPALVGSPANLVIMTSSAVTDGLVGSVGATYDSSKAVPGNTVTLHETFIGTRTHHNPYQAELVAIELALNGLPRGLRGRHIIVGTSNLGAVRAIARPKQQSGQQYIEGIYRTAQTLKRNGNTVSTAWAPAQETYELKSLAKHAARSALQQGHISLANFPKTKATVLRNALAKEEATPIPSHVGRFS